MTSVIEVLVERQDDKWWKEYRKKLEERFEQEKLFMRALG
jgi:hypothetical protein